MPCTPEGEEGRWRRGRWGRGGGKVIVSHVPHAVHSPVCVEESSQL